MNASTSGDRTHDPVCRKEASRDDSLGNEGEYGMRMRPVRAASLLLFLAFGVAAGAQFGHPLKG
jgi:hypothetical protein